MAAAHERLERWAMRSNGYMGWIMGFVLGVAVLAGPPAWADTVLDPTWPDEDAYQLIALAGEDPELSGSLDIVSTYWARDEIQDYWFFRVHVRDQAQSQLTSVAHAVYLDVNGDLTFEYILYNTTHGSSSSELAYWNSTPGEWDTDAQPPAYIYTGGTNDPDSEDNFIELAVPGSHIGSPVVLTQVGGIKGSLDVDGDISNSPNLSDFNDITDPGALPEPATLALFGIGSLALAALARRRRSA